MPQNPEVAAIGILLTKLGDIAQEIAKISSDNSVLGLTNKNISKESFFVDPSRLEELRNIQSNDFDLIKVSRYCEEINIAYEHDCYLAVPMLGRAILDHIPPIFGFKSFSEVANNYSGSGKSFKQSMDHLENSLRKIADTHLHGQIRKRETLPSRVQVNFSSDLDVLLAEIVRILK